MKFCWMLAAVVVATAGCDKGFFTQPAPPLPASLNVSYSVNSATSAAAAFDKIDRVHVKVIGPGVAIDTVLTFTPAGEARVRLQLSGVPAEPSTYTVEVGLLRGPDLLFVASTSTEIVEGETKSLELHLVPVVSFQVSFLPGLFTAIGDTASVRRAAVFATGDTLTGVVFTFSSSNPAVATVTSAGLVRSVGEGTAQITVNAGGVAIGPLSVAVNPEIATVTFPAAVDTIDAGQQRTYGVTLRDRNGNVITRPVNYALQSQGVAQLVGGPNNGTVVGVAAGTVSLTATTIATPQTPSKTASLMIVVRPSPVAQIQITPTTTRTLLPGETQQFTAVAKDNTGNVVNNPAIRWSSSNPAVARVDSITGVVTAVANGNATITARVGTTTSNPATATVCGGPPTMTGGVFSLLPAAGIFPGPAPASFGGVPVLFAGGLAFGTSGTDIVVGLDMRGQLPPHLDSNAPVCSMAVAGGNYTRSRLRIIKTAPLPPVDVIQETFTTGGGFVLVRYTFTNTSASNISLRVGLALDWDLLFDNSANTDFTRFNPTVNAAEAFETDGKTAGIAGVSTNIVGYSRGTNGPPNPDPLTTAEYYARLAPGISTGVAGPADIRQYVSFGDIAIPAGQSQSITFTFAGGLSETAFSTNVQAARTTAFPTVPGF